MRDCLARIAARDERVHAWANVDPELALAQARALDRDRRARLPLHGVPIGVKDIIDTSTCRPRWARRSIAAIARRRRRLRGAGSRRRRGDPGQDRDLRIRRHDAGADHQSAQPRPHARRLVERIGARRSRTAWCRSRSAPRPAARCCGPRPIAACSATSRPSTPSTATASIPRRKASTPIGLIARSLDDIDLLSAVLELRHALPAANRWSALRVSGSAARQCGARPSRKPWPPSRMRPRGLPRPGRRSPA